MEKSHVNFQLEVKFPAEFHHYFTTKSNPICIPQQCYQQCFALIDRNWEICYKTLTYISEFIWVRLYGHLRSISNPADELDIGGFRGLDMTKQPCVLDIIWSTFSAT